MVKRRVREMHGIHFAAAELFDEEVDRTGELGGVRHVAGILVPVAALEDLIRIRRARGTPEERAAAAVLRAVAAGRCELRAGCDSGHWRSSFEKVTIVVTS